MSEVPLYAPGLCGTRIFAALNRTAPHTIIHYKIALCRTSSFIALCRTPLFITHIFTLPLKPPPRPPPVVLLIHHTQVYDPFMRVTN